MDCAAWGRGAQTGLGHCEVPQGCAGSMYLTKEKWHLTQLPLGPVLRYIRSCAENLRYMKSCATIKRGALSHTTYYFLNPYSNA